MKIFEPFKYLYYRIYTLQFRWFGEDHVPDVVAAVSVSTLLWLNIYAVLIAVSDWTSFKPVDPLSPDKFKLGLILAFLISINFFIFIRNKYYEQLPAQFKGESKFKRRIHLLFIFAYVILSLIFPFIT